MSEQKPSEDKDCLHCVLLRVILDRATAARAAGKEHDPMEDIVLVAQVLAQLLAANPDKTLRPIIAGETIKLLADEFNRNSAKTDQILAERAKAGSNVTKLSDFIGGMKH